MHRGKDGSREQAAMSGQEACGATTDGDGRDSDRRAGKKPIAMERHRDHPREGQIRPTSRTVGLSQPMAEMAQSGDDWPESL